MHIDIKWCPWFWCQHQNKWCLWFCREKWTKKFPPVTDLPPRQGHQLVGHVSKTRGGQFVPPKGARVAVSSIEPGTHEHDVWVEILDKKKIQNQEIKTFILWCFKNYNPHELRMKYSIIIINKELKKKC